MSGPIELIPVTSENPQVELIQTQTDSRSRTNFWLIIAVIILIVILIVLIIAFVFAPVNKIKSDANIVTSTIQTLSPKVDKLTSDGETTLTLVDGFVKTAQSDLDKIASDGEQTLKTAETLVETAQIDLSNAIFDFCNLTSVGGVDINIRTAFPTLCKNIPPLPLNKIDPGETNIGTSEKNGIGTSENNGNVVKMSQQNSCGNGCGGMPRRHYNYKCTHCYNPGYTYVDPSFQNCHSTGKNIYNRRTISTGQPVSAWKSYLRNNRIFPNK